MKKVLAVFLCLASLFFSTTAYAAQTAEIYADDMVVSEGETIIFPVNIKNNKGIMGFKLTFTYDTSCFNVVTVDRGELTESGNFMSSGMTARSARATKAFYFCRLK